MLADPSVRAEAALSVVQIAICFRPLKQRRDGGVRKVMADNTDQPSFSAEKHGKNLEDAGFVTLWQVAGPYEQKGKDYSELFNIPFAPKMEMRGRSTAKPARQRQSG